jgi:hypothetical protein
VAEIIQVTWSAAKFRRCGMREHFGQGKSTKIDAAEDPQVTAYSKHTGVCAFPEKGSAGLFAKEIKEQWLTLSRSLVTVTE